MKVMATLVTTETLKDAPKNAMLWCSECGAQFSANYSDYSFWRDDKPFICENGHPTTNMVLAIEHYTIEVITHD